MQFYSLEFLNQYRGVLSPSACLIPSIPRAGCTSGRNCLILRGTRSIHGAGSNESRGLPKVSRHPRDHRDIPWSWRILQRDD
jgi:hypothetical protein